MALTRSQTDTILVGRVGAYLAAVGKSVAVDGTNPDLIDPLMEGLGSLGLALTTYGAVGLADLASVTAASTPQLIDVAELRALRNVYGNYVAFDETTGLSTRKFDQLRQGLDKRIVELQELVRTRYGLGLGSIGSGAIDLDFAASDPSVTDSLWPGYGGS